MTALNPKHLDALDALIAHNMQWRGLEDIDRDAYKQAREAITALRAKNDALLQQVDVWQDAAHQKDRLHQSAIKVIAKSSEENENLRDQIDRERAATVEAAAECVGNLLLAEYVSKKRRMAILDRIRALHTDATRAAIDAIRREGYEAGVREARQLCAMVDEPTNPGNAHDAMIFHIGFTAGRKGCEKAIAARIPPDPIDFSIPPDPDTTPRK